uniref:TRAF-type domain-containing protein n=1 Tax=Clytia hemisphaerica TaxID=252671 RepID=A0A7M5UPS8_9CNID
VGEHLLRDCLYEKIECNFHALGCHEMVERGKMREHHKENVVEHQLMMLDDYKTTKQKNEELEGKLEEANKRIDQLEDRLKQSETKCIKLHQNTFSIVDTISYWIKFYFQTQEGSDSTLTNT